MSENETLRHNTKDKSGKYTQAKLRQDGTPAQTNEDVRTKQINHLVSLGILPESASPNGRGKRKTKLSSEDYRLIERFARLGCSMSEIAEGIGMSHDTLQRAERREKARLKGKTRLARTVEAGRDARKRFIRDAIDKAVKRGNSTIIKHVAENELNQTPVVNVMHNHQFSDMDRSALLALAGVIDVEYGPKQLPPGGQTDSDTVTVEYDPDN